MADRPIPARSEVPEESTWNLKDVFIFPLYHACFFYPYITL